MVAEELRDRLGALAAWHAEEARRNDRYVDAQAKAADRAVSASDANRCSKRSLYHRKLADFHGDAFEVLTLAASLPSPKVKPDA